MFLFISLINVWAQEYHVEIYLTGVACPSFNGIHYISVSVSYGGQSGSINNYRGGFPVKLLDANYSSPPSGSMSYTALQFNGLLDDCSGGESGTKSINLASSYACIPQIGTFNTGSPTISYYVVWTPINTLTITEPSGSTNICETESIDFTASPTGYGTYDWSYKTEGQSSFSSIGSYTNPNQSFTATDIFGVNVSSNYGKEITFKLELGGCSVETTNPYRFYPTVPVVTNHSQGDVSCFGETTGSITIVGASQTSRSHMAGESFTYMLYNKWPDFSEPDDWDGSTSAKSEDSRTTSSRDTEIEFTGLEAGDYWVFIYPELIPDDTNVSSGCGDAYFYPITIEEPDEALSFGYEKTDVSC
ncbi:MAG: hypothetical protein GY820_36535, partial [Gammaproteobacteria bacterium]|nr:hypothetical protein [Gammaproteobacteria bacterium]